MSEFSAGPPTNVARPGQPTPTGGPKLGRRPDYCSQLGNGHSRRDPRVSFWNCVARTRPGRNRQGEHAMLGIDEEQRQATLRLHEALGGSRVGLRWERMLRRHAGEIDALVTVDGSLRRLVVEALMRLALLDEGDVLDEATVTSAHRVLEQLQIRGGVSLQRDASCWGGGLARARGLSLAQALAGPRPPADHVPAQRLASV